MVADIWRSLTSRISFRHLILLHMHIRSWQLTSDKRDLQELNKMFTLRILHTRQTCAEYGKPFYYLLRKIDILYIISDILYRI